MKVVGYMQLTFPAGVNTLGDSNGIVASVVDGGAAGVSTITLNGGGLAAGKYSVAFTPSQAPTNGIGFGLVDVSNTVKTFTTTLAAVATDIPGTLTFFAEGDP